MDVSFLAFDSASDPLQFEIGLCNVKPSLGSLRRYSFSHDEPLRGDLKVTAVAAFRLYNLRLETPVPQRELRELRIVSYARAYRASQAVMPQGQAELQRDSSVTQRRLFDAAGRARE